MKKKICLAVVFVAVAGALGLGAVVVTTDSSSGIEASAAASETVVESEAEAEAEAEAEPEVAVPVGIMAEIPDIYYDNEAEEWTIPEGYYATDSMEKHLKRLNKNLKLNIQVNILDREFILQKYEIANMTDVTNGGIDYNTLYSWCKYIADGYGSATTFRSWNGEIVSLPTGDLTITETFTTYDVISQIYPAMLNFEDIELSFEPALGAKYIDCDLTNQKVFWFENGLCTLSTDCVSGKTSTPTPTGTFYIKNLLGRTCLNGPTWSTWVNNWSAFYKGCGLHDATWQSSFGLARWQAGYGSHGCVNLPLSVANEMKNHMEVGEAMVVYTR
ncbi:MAG: L,D-transpeptidase [Clostridiales bacterium]|nr:L,D-transpeptidase [Clostridiales bacterium]